MVCRVKIDGEISWHKFVIGEKIREITDRGYVSTDFILKLINLVRTAGKRGGL